MKNRLIIFKLVFILGLVSLMVFSTSCAKTPDEEAQNEKAGGESSVEVDGNVSVSENTVKYESDDNQTKFEVDIKGNASIPEGYPSDIVPLYPKARVSLAGKEANGYTVAMKTDDSIDDVYKFYEENAKLEEGSMKQNGDGVATIMGVSGDLNVSIMVTENNFDDDGKNLISIAIGN